MRIDGLRAAWSKHSVLYLMKGLAESAMSSGPIDPGLSEDNHQGPYALLAWNEGPHLLASSCLTSTKSDNPLVGGTAKHPGSGDEGDMGLESGNAPSTYDSVRH